MKTLYDAEGKTCWITVTESVATRYLQLDGCEEGAMDLKDERPIFQYLWFHKCSHLATGVRRCLVLGAGAFTAAKCLALDHAGTPIEAVDVEPELEPVARRFFRLDRSEFASISFHGIAAEAFLEASTQPYDFIFDDLFDGFEHVPRSSRVAGHFSQMRRVLADGGVCVKNLIWNPLSADTRAACEEAVEALAATFPHYAVLALGDAERGHNRLLLASAGSTPLDWRELRAPLAAAGMPDYLLRETRCVRSA